MAKLKATIYVDGSYDSKSNYIGCGILIYLEGAKRPQRIAFKKQIKSELNRGSNIAEMTAVKTAIKAAHSLGATKITIYYDWSGLEIFSHEENLKTRHLLYNSFQNYVVFIKKHKNNMGIKFVKVKAHSDDKLNDEVDKMARTGKAKQ
ncbi:MAG: RNase H family protein [Oscillospiraceae bacterium]